MKWLKAALAWTWKLIKSFKPGAHYYDDGSD